MLTLRSASQPKEKKSATILCNPMASATNRNANPSVQLELDESTLEKAPEGLPLLDQLMKCLKPNPKEWVEAKKRSRSVVLSSVPEAEKGTHAVEGQQHTERAVMEILGVSEVEVRPVEIFMMGRMAESNPRLIKNFRPRTIR
ncbi:hypothetical protein ANCDUO_23464 [Ancylostoma duodenale]|uniref:Uncharacterized protein n=1 Tax=Ancylostoma duodenale TaxID=51022 RepID=A0A0C2BRN8_9BILA|nr:hypothetical protein ANCDUO_23464 [Ancylostoma duodenale]